MADYISTSEYWANSYWGNGYWGNRSWEKIPAPILEIKSSLLTSIILITYIKDCIKKSSFLVNKLMATSYLLNKDK